MFYYNPLLKLLIMLSFNQVSYTDPDVDNNVLWMARRKKKTLLECGHNLMELE